MNSREPSDWVLGWQTKLHGWAVDDPHRRFPDPYNLVYDLRTLHQAWEHLKANEGSQTAGVDGVTRYHVEHRVGLLAFLGELHTALKPHQYRPQPVRQKGIPKAHGKVRYLGIPPSGTGSYSRPCGWCWNPSSKRTSIRRPMPIGRADARKMRSPKSISSCAGYTWVIEGDIRACFD